MARKFLLIASLSALLAVVLGAFGAHGLKAILDASGQATYETGVRYHFYHTFGLFIVALLLQQRYTKWLRNAGWFFILGMFLFSGSLYLLSVFGWKWLGPITPIGGTFFIIGWGCIFWNYLKKE